MMGLHKCRVHNNSSDSDSDSGCICRPPLFANC